MSITHSTAEKPRKKRGPLPDPGYTGPPLVFTIKTFCSAHPMSAAKFHALVAEGKGPRLMRVGRRVYITAESAAAWRAEREAESNSTI